MVVGLGTGVRSAAEVLIDLGWSVVAWDRDPDRSRAWAAARGVELATDQDRPFPAVTLVIVSAAIDRTHRVYAAADAADVPVVDYPTFLASWTAVVPTVAISGTHGKSTTLALLRWALPQAGVAGGFECHDGPTGRFGRDLIVVEACEYRAHFTRLHPNAGCVLNIEHDHPDSFAGIDQTVAAFQRFVDRIPGDGTLFLSADCPNASRLVTSARRVWFSVNQRVRPIVARDPVYRLTAGDVETFKLTLPSGEAQELTVPNLARPLWPSLAAAAAIAHESGDGRTLPSRLSGFPGLRQRFEVQAEGKTVWISDYAHHPTAVASVLAEVRRRWPDRLLLAVFEPHQAVRLASFASGFANALQLADEVWLLPIFTAREAVTAEDAGARLADFAASLTVPNRRTRDVRDLAEQLAKRLASDDLATVVVQMGAGRIHGPELAALRERLSVASASTETHDACGDHDDLGR